MKKDLVSNHYNQATNKGFLKFSTAKATKQNKEYVLIL